jgi:hypothetical protein
VRSSRVLVASIVLLAASCADAAPTSNGSRPESTLTVGPDTLVASCDGVEFPSVQPDTSAFTPFESWSDVDVTDLGSESRYFREFVGMFDWFTTQEAANSIVLFGEPLERPRGRNPYAYATLEVRQGQWVPVGWGHCGIRLSAPGWGNAQFVVDPSQPPDPNSDRMTVLATEVACAGGEAPTDREVLSIVVGENTESVSVVILVEPTRGATTCQGNPPFEFELELDQPLGDRAVKDASAYPAEVRWPV